MTDRIAPRSGVAFTLPKDKILCVTDPEGGQVSDLLAFRAADPRVAISNGRTFDYEETIRLTTGNRLWSNRSNALLEIVEDSCGIHDFLLTPCSEATFRHFYADKPVHRGCFGNLAEALLPYGIAADAIPVAFKPVHERASRQRRQDPRSSTDDEAWRFHPSSGARRSDHRTDRLLGL